LFDPNERLLPADQGNFYLQHRFGRGERLHQHGDTGVRAEQQR
jgi:hypothetical protein